MQITLSFRLIISNNQTAQARMPEFQEIYVDLNQKMDVCCLCTFTNCLIQQINCPLICILFRVKQFSSAHFVLVLYLIKHHSTIYLIF